MEFSTAPQAGHAEMRLHVGVGVGQDGGDHVAGIYAAFRKA
jgi:hypothetical protein